MNILVSDPIGQSGMEYLKKCGYVVTLRPTITTEELLQDIAGYDALVVRSRTHVTKELIEKGTGLKVIARSGAGVDTIDVAAATEKNIVVVNAPGANAEAVAEHTMALMLSLARDIVPTSTKLSAGEWTKSSYRGIELKGKTLGIIGFGMIGSRVAELGAAFGMRIVVFTKSQTPEKKKHLDACRGTFVDLHTLAKDSDVISVHVSLSDETRGLLSKEIIAQIKPISYVINTSRGAVIDEDALISALQNGALAGAALDVFQSEPLSPASPLCRLSNVVLTPHIAANSKESEERASVLIADDIDRVLQGKVAIRRVTI